MALSKTIKIWLIIISVPIMLLVIGIIGLKLYLTSERLKALIIPKIEEATNRTVSVQDISFTILPSLAISIKELKISNPKGLSFDKNEFLSLDNIKLKVNIFELLNNKLEINYIETPEDELEAEALAQEERQRAGVSPTFKVGEAAGEALGGAVGYVGKEAVIGAKYVGKEIKKGAGYLEEKAKAGFEALKERFRRDTGREPTPDEEDRMAEDVVNQIAAEEGVPEAPRMPEEAEPAIAEPETPPMPITPQGYIPEEQAQEIVEDLRRQKIIKNNKNKVGQL